MRRFLISAAAIVCAAWTFAAEGDVAVSFVHAKDIALPKGASWNDAGAWEFCAWPEAAPPPAAKDLDVFRFPRKGPFILDINTASLHLNWYHAYALEQKHIPPTATFSKIATSFAVLIGKEGETFRVSLTPRLVYDTGNHEGEITAKEAASEIFSVPPGGVLVRPKHPLPKRMLRAPGGGVEGGALFFKTVPAPAEK